MEQVNKNPIKIPDITGDLNKLNEVADRAGLPIPNNSDYTSVIPTTQEHINSIALPTEQNASGQPSQSDPFLDTIKGAGFNASVGNTYQQGPDLSKYKDYVNNTGFAISTPLDMIDKERAINQSNWEQAGNALGRVAGNILPEIGQQVSRMFDWSGDMSKDNAAAQAFQEWKDIVNEATPIYRENPEESFNFGDFAYWMEQGSGIATSALAFAAIGYATGGLAAGALGATGRAANLLVPISMRTATGTRIAGYLKNAGSAVATSKALTHAESVGVSIDTYNESADVTRKREKENQAESGKTDEEIELTVKAEASKAASFAYNMNQVNFFLNLTSAFKFGTLGRVGSRGRLATDGLGVSALNTSRRTIGKEVLKDTGELALEAGQEYVEETINFVAQKRGVEGGADAGFNENFRKSIDAAMTEKGVEAGFWGAIGGMAQTGATSAGSYIPMYKNKGYDEAYQAAKGRLAQENVDGKNTYTKEEISTEAKKEAEKKAGKDGRVSKKYMEGFREEQMVNARKEILDQFGMNISEDGTDASFSSKTGEDIRNTSDLLNSIDEQTRAFDEYDEAMALNDVDRANDIKQRFATNQIMTAIKNGTANTLERAYQGIANLTGEQAVEYGLTDDASDLSFKDNAKRNIKKLKKLESQVQRNRDFINKDHVNDIDADIIHLEEEYKDLLKRKLSKVVGAVPDFDDDGAAANLSIAMTAYDEAVEDGDSSKSLEQIEQLQQEVKMYRDVLDNKQKLYNEKVDKNVLDQKHEIYKELNNLDKRASALKNQRETLTSKPMQKALKAIMEAVEQSKITAANNIRDAKIKEQEEEKKRKREEAKNAKQTKKNETPPASTPPASTPPASTPPASTSTEETERTESTEEAKEVIVIPPITPPVVSNIAFDVHSNPSFSALLDKLGKDNSFIKAYGGFISKQLQKLKERQDGTTTNIDGSEDVFEFLNTLIATFNDEITTGSIIKQNILLQSYPDLQAFVDNDPSIFSTINNMFRSEIERFEAIRGSLEGLRTGIGNIITNNTKEPEDDASLSMDDNAEENEDSSDGVFDVDAHIEAQRNQPPPLNFKSTAQIITDVATLLDTMGKNGINISTWEDFYVQLVNASSKDSVNSILPRLKGIWNFMVQDNLLAGNIVSEDDYQIDESLDEVEDAADASDINQSWGPDKATAVERQAANVVSDIVQSTPTGTPILVRSGSGMKSNTIFKLAYAAREYILRTIMRDGIRIDTKTDFDDSLNENNEYDLFDTANLIPGTELTLIPLNVGETYRYYDTQQRKNVVVTRVSVDKIEMTKEGERVEILDAVDHMPIFISKSSSRKDIIDGAFLHLPTWASTDNMSGDEVDVKLQQQMLRDFRQTIVNNVNKKGNNKGKAHIKIKIRDKTAGIPITTKGTVGKVNTRLSENLPLALNIEGGMITAQGESAVFVNKSADSLPMGTVYAMLPTPVGNVAYPLQRTTLKDTDVKQSIMTVLDLFFSVKETRTDEQNKQIEEFKRLGLNLNEFKSVQNYLNKLLYTGHLRNADPLNKKLFDTLLQNPVPELKGKPLFRLAVADGKPYLQFGRIGTSGSELSFDTAENKEAVMSALSIVLNDSYANISADEINGKRRVIGIKEIDGVMTPTVLYNTYNDMIKDHSITSLSPKVVTNPNTGKETTIYTFQQTIALEIPLTNEVSEEGEITPIPAVVPTEEVVTENTEEDIVEEEEEDDDDDIDDDGLSYSFEDEAESEDDSSNSEEDSAEEEYTLEQAIAPYTYIPGLPILVQNSVVFDAINKIYKAVLEEGTPKGIEAAVNETMMEIASYYNSELDAINDKIAKGKYKSQEDQEKAIKRLNAIKEKLDVLIASKDKITKRVKLIITQEGLAVRLSGKAKKKYLEKIAKQKEVNNDENEAEDLGLAPIRTDAEKESLLENGERIPNEYDEDTVVNEEEEAEMSFDKDAMTVSPVASLTLELKQFFNSIKQTVYEEDKKTKEFKFKQVKNFFGLHPTVPFNIVFQKVQELLAQYPTEDYKKPDINNFIQILKDNQRRAPYLTDVITRLEDPATTEDFKNAFVLGMYKMYNNTVFTNVNRVENEETESSHFASAVTSVTANNVVSLYIKQWNEEIEAQGILQDIERDGRNVRILDPAVRAELQILYQRLPSSKNMMMDLVRIYKIIGVTIPVQMLNDIGNGIFKYNDKYFNVAAFIKLPMVKHSIESVIGNMASGSNGIVDANTEPIYSNSAFLQLAKVFATYNNNLTSNSARNLNGDVIFEISEVKNLVESYYAAKDASAIEKQNTDPYHRRDFDPNKKHKSWRESSVIKAITGFVANTASNFAKSFRYYTLSGMKIKDSAGTTVKEVEKMTENDHILNNILMFLNQGKIVGSKSNEEHLALFPYLTMSDKKQPMGFSAPTFKVDTNLFFMRLDAMPNQQEAQQQIDYLYDVLLLGDIQRIEHLASAKNTINIKEYTKENAKFYILPALNLIDFNYINGNTDKGLDEAGTLRERLGLTKEENLFRLEGTGSDTKRVVDLNVLRKPEVIAFLKQEMLKQLHLQTQQTLIQLQNAGLVNTITNENGVVTGYAFNESSKIDTETLKNMGYGMNGDGIENFIYNYTINSTLALAQMQDTLIGDPIQYAKYSKETIEIKEELQAILESNAKLILGVQEGTITQTQAENMSNQLKRRQADAEFRLIKAHGQLDVVASNDNQGKRLAADNASGQMPVFSANNVSYNLLVMNDVEIGTTNKDHYLKYLVHESIKQMEDGKVKDDLIDAILNKYLNINQADAQEFTTLKEHLDTMVALQEISRNEADRLLEDDNNGKLNPSEYSTILQSMKMVYAERFNRDGIHSKLYVKSSSFPLSNTFTEGLPIEGLYKHMVDNKIQRAAFKSAVKVGSPIKTANVFNKDGTINKEGLSNSDSSIIKNVPRSGMKKQQNVPYKEDKTEINDVTQKAKLTFVNLMDTPGFIDPETGLEVNGRQLHEKYLDAYREMFRLRHEELRKELYPKGLNAGLDYKALHRLILAEAESRGYSENDIAFLELNNEQTNFLFPLWLSGNEKKLSSLLNSIVDNRIRKRKREGTSAVLVSDIAIATNPEYKSNIVYTTNDRGNQLRSMRDSETGELLEAEVIIPFRFRDSKGKLLKASDFTTKDENGNTIIDMERVPSDVLDILGSRIPYQGLNSGLAIKIVGFLPEGYENVIIAPADVVTQMGSDFDVDKMYQDFINTVYEDGKLRRLTPADLVLRNKINEYREELRNLKNAKDKNDITAVSAISNNLIKLRGELSQQDYLNQDKHLPKDLELKLLEDKIFDIQKAVLMNPHEDVQVQRVQPIDSATFVNITEKIMPEVYDSNLPNSWSPYTIAHQIKKYINARGGKVGVSTWSSTSVLNAVLQGIDYLVSPMHLQRYNSNTKNYEQLSFEFMGQKSVALNDPKSSRGGLKSDIIQALQSITVDNENLQIMHKLNLNEHTNDFIRAAILLGFDEESIFYFINHPVVKEVVKGKASGNIIKRPKSTYTVSTTTADGRIVEEQKDYAKSNLEVLIKTMTKEQLLNDITNEHFDESSAKHYAIYSFFMELSKHGKSFKSLESLMNVDSKGIGSNLFYSLEKEAALMKLNSNKEITNVDKLLGDFADSYTPSKDTPIEKIPELRKEYNQAMRKKGYIQTENGWFKPNTIPSMAAGFALITNNRLWSKAFPYQRTDIAHIATVGLALQNNKNTDQIHSLSEKNTKKGSTFINNEIDTESIGSASPKKDSEHKQDVIEHLKSYLYSVATDMMDISNNSLIELAEEIRDMNPNNLFLKKLSVEKLNRDNNINILVFDGGSKETGIDNNMVNDIIDLLVHNDPTVVNFMKNLILQQLSFGGIQQAKQFVKHIPPHYLKHLGIYSLINDNLNALDYNSFIGQYIQHNPNLVVSDELLKLYRSGGIKITQESFILPDAEMTPEITNNERYAYISILESNGQYTLFKRDANKPNLFTAVPVLGQGSIREYSNKESIPESKFPNNNPKEKWYKRPDSMTSLPIEEYNRVRSIINTKLGIGIRTPDSENAIVKVCK